MKAEESVLLDCQMNWASFRHFLTFSLLYKITLKVTLNLNLSFPITGSCSATHEAIKQKMTKN